MIRLLYYTLVSTIFFVSSVQSQTILWTENFETGTPGVAINTTDVGSSATADNPWVINDIYAGGSGTFLCLGFGFPFTVPPAPAQPAGITNSPNSNYLHITPQIAINGGGTLPTASYVTADGVCILGGTNAFSRMTSDVATTGFDSVTFDYWWACGGSTLYYGELYYSIDGGVSWTSVLNPNTGTSSWSGQITWTNTTLSNPIWSNQASLRFGFRFVSGTSASGADLDPGYAVDELEITGYTLCSPSSSTITATDCSSYTTPSGIVLNSSNTYTDTISNVNGCDSIITINLTIGNASSNITTTACSSYTAPSGQIFTASGTFSDTIPTFGACDSIITINLTIGNASSNITATACNSYTAPSGHVFTTSGTFNDTISTFGGCDSMLIISLQITTIDTSITLLGMTLNANDTSQGTNYQWIDCSNNTIINGATNPSFTALANGSYAVVLTQNNCVDTSACEQIFGLGLKQVDIASNWRLYPNPTSGAFILDLGMPLDLESLIIYNQLGQIIVETKNTQSQQIAVDLDASNGIYFIKVKTANGIVKTLKILKQD